MGQWYDQCILTNTRADILKQSGKTYALAMEDDLPDTIGTFRYYGGWADKSFGQTIETSPEKFAYTLRQPFGVVGQIIPW